MKRIITTTLFCLFGFLGLYAQSNTVKGKVTGDDTNPLPSATVMLLQATDSVLASFSLTDEEGLFEIKNIKEGDYVLRFTYVGYAVLDTAIQFPERSGKIIDLGTITMLGQSELLEGVTIFGEADPVKIKNDTLELNAASFGSQQNDVVEDLLKRLPGVEVDRDGNITAQGEQVQRVLVDGKEFFGSDPKVATRNLPAKAIDKVQIFDRKSDQSQFTGIDDGSEEKTINLTLREDHKTGQFGNLGFGYGDEGRFSGRATINRFSGNTQLAFIGTANNVNQQGFSIGDYINFMGGMSRMSRGGRFQMGGNGIPIANGQASGIASTYAGGLNFNHEFSDKTDLNASYFYSRIDKETVRNAYQETFLEGTNSFFSDEFSNQNDLNNNHALNVRFETELDSSQSIVFRTNLSYNDTEVNQFSESSSLNNENVLTNQSIQDNQTQGNGLRLTSSLLYRLKFGKAGRTLSADLDLSRNDNNYDGNQNFDNLFVVSGQESNELLVQDFLQDNQVTGYGARFTYTEPLGNRRYLEFNYSYSKNQNDVQQEIFDIEGGTPIFNTTLSNLYRSDYTYNRAGINLLINRRNYNFTLGAEYQNSKLDGLLELSDTEINNLFENILPQARFQYNFSSANNLRVDYSTSVIEPSITQLQPIVDNSNPLSLYVGNPDLRPEFRNRINARFFSFNQFTFTNFFASVNFTYTTNKIVNAQSIDERLVRTSSPLNVDQDYRLTGSLNYGSRFGFINWRYNISPRFTYSRGITFINLIENNTDQYLGSMTLRFDNQQKDKIDLGFGGTLSYNTTQYSIANDQNRDFLNHEYFVDVTVNPSSAWMIESSLDYRIFSGLSDEFNQQIPIWSASVSRFFMKGKRLQLKAEVFDILNQNRGITRTAALNYTLDEQVNALGTYFLVSAIYNLRGFEAEPRGDFRFSKGD